MFWQYWHFGISGNPAAGDSHVGCEDKDISIPGHKPHRDIVDFFLDVLGQLLIFLLLDVLPELLPLLLQLLADLIQEVGVVLVNMEVRKVIDHARDLRMSVQEYLQRLRMFS